jgi:hypothetical protein
MALGGTAASMEEGSKGDVDLPLRKTGGTDPFVSGNRRHVFALVG